MSSLYGDLPPPAIGGKDPTSLAIPKKFITPPPQKPTTIQITPPTPVVPDKKKPPPIPRALLQKIKPSESTVGEVPTKRPRQTATSDVQEVQLPSSTPDDQFLSTKEIKNEYNPARPNDYEEYCLEREQRKQQENQERRMRRELERVEKERAKTTPATKLDLNVSTGEEAFLRRARMSAPGAGLGAGGGNSELSGSGSGGSGGGGGGGGDKVRRMMEGMGWTDGQGLGRNEQGISEPLRASPAINKNSGIGSGSSGSITSISSGTVFPPGVAIIQENSKTHSPKPTRVVLLRNMVGRGQVDDELEAETAEECAKYGKVLRCVVHEASNCSDAEAVRIFVHFSDLSSALKAVKDLSGRFFAGRVVKASYIKEDAFARKEYAI